MVFFFFLRGPISYLLPGVQFSPWTSEKQHDTNHDWKKYEIIANEVSLRLLCPLWHYTGPLLKLTFERWETSRGPSLLLCLTLTGQRHIIIIIIIIKIKYYAYGAFMHNMGVVVYCLRVRACAQTVWAHAGLINGTNVTLLWQSDTAPIPGIHPPTTTTTTYLSTQTHSPNLQPPTSHTHIPSGCVFAKGRALSRRRNKVATFPAMPLSDWGEESWLDNNSSNNKNNSSISSSSKTNSSSSSSRSVNPA